MIYHNTEGNSKFVDIMTVLNGTFYTHTKFPSDRSFYARYGEIRCALRLAAAFYGGVLSIPQNDQTDDEQRNELILASI